MSGREEQRAEDARARQVAQARFDRPLVLEAGAGTGKTATLVARVVSWCCGEGWELTAAEGSRSEPDDIAARTLDGVVAITFTEAAAAEMATRVGEAFAAVEQSREPGASGSVESWPPGLESEHLPEQGTCRIRARALLAALDHLSVRTIHAFCARILTAHPLEAGLPPSFAVDPEGEAVAEIVRDVLEERLGDSTGGVATTEPDPIVELLAQDVSPDSIIECACRLLGGGAELAALDADPFAAQGLWDVHADILTSLEELMSRGGDAMVAVKAPKAVATATALGLLRTRFAALEAEEAGTVERLIALLDETLPEDLTGRLGDWAKGKLAKAEASALGPGAGPFTEEAKRLAVLLKGLRGTKPELLRPALAVLRPLLAEAKRRMLLGGVLTYGDLLVGAVTLLREQQGVLGRLRRGMSQLLVDEFQDTDRLQCELVRMLALEGPEDERPGLFIVGDPKQSIYGWRSADLSAYEEFLRWVGEAGGEQHALTVSFRSVPAVLDEVEQVIAPNMPASPGLQPAFAPLLTCPRLADATGFVTAGRSAIEYWDSRAWDPAADRPAPQTKATLAAEIEAVALADDVQQIHDSERCPWSHFAILLRSTTNQELFLNALRAKGIPFAVAKDKSYYRRREVIEASCLVRAVLDPLDQLALVGLLRSPFVGVPDAAWIPLWSLDFPRRVLGLGCDDGAGLAELTELTERVASELAASGHGVPGWDLSLTSALTAIHELRRDFEVLAPDVFVEDLRSRFAVDALAAGRYLGAYRVANLERFFRTLHEDLADPELSVDALLRRLRRGVANTPDAVEARPPAGDDDALQVMTIHGAKGLDFEHVYLPQLHAKPSGNQVRDTLVVRDGQVHFSLLGAASLRFPEHLARESAVESAERVRLLYVAMTRAKQRLVLLGTPQARALPMEASNFAGLLPARQGGWPDDSVRDALDGEGDVTLGARWRLPSHQSQEEEQRTTPSQVARDGLVLASKEELLRESTRLHERRAQAESRMGRSLSRAPSAGGEVPPRRVGVASPEVVEARVARAVGTAIHLTLEELSLDRAPAVAWAEAVERLPDVVDRTCSPALRQACLEGLRSFCERFEDSACLRRLFELGSDVIARELVVLAPAPESEDVQTHASGTVDLVYRDPADGRVVVADFKTDRVEEDSAVEARLAVHADQGRFYAEAVSEAFGLTESPRVEFWFLHPDRILTLE